MINPHIQSLILQATSAEKLYKIESIQSLWSGYGEIVRYGLHGGDAKTVVVKHVQLPDQSQHPRGWNTDLSHQRKIKSYQIEIAWYSQWSQYCSDNCRVPLCLATESEQNEMFMLLEDLDSAGFEVRKNRVSINDINACLSWLAHFHATFLMEQPKNLWPIGTYWHLATRPDELNALQDSPLKNAAALIDHTLNNCTYKTFVHGDAKLANFCFSAQENRVAAVDFQYIGGGCGMKDVAYFIGSCLNEHQCQQQIPALLDYYFSTLKIALSMQGKSVDVKAVELEWRMLFPIAWTDFHRFIKGWSPEHWKINSYSEKMAHDVIAQLSHSPTFTP